jgi:hypothetical protein
MPTATIITAITYGLGSIESLAGWRVTTTHSPTGKYRARCVPNSAIPLIVRKKAIFQPFSFAGGSRAVCGRLTKSVEACGPILLGTARSGWVDQRLA